MVKFDTDTDGWDVGLIIDYWSRQSSNDELTAVVLGYKALSLFAVAVYPRPSDLARLSRDRIERLAHGIRYRYLGTKKLRALPKFTEQHGLGLAMQELVCPAHALEAYIDRTADPSIYFHSDPAAAASAAIDSGVAIDVVLSTGHWTSWTVFHKFYNRAKLRAVVPLVGRTSMA